ncbi:hypothetical protein [Ruania zhangjianzhongii]|uniref:hypothetical protein n=1 Tax=Ruania zhangjianzhongii TaxID=2603206 RepID=UPI00143DAA9A|nr:hypothetical protein [Ruania zhangjianzhongii]
MVDGASTLEEGRVLVDLSGAGPTMYVSGVGAVQRAVDTGGRVREVADIALGVRR